jgi:drug/metabolite transporter (DMT)-like permease
MFFTPFLTSLLGFLLAGEVPDTATLLGGGIILLGVFTFNFGGRFFSARQRQLAKP